MKKIACSVLDVKAGFYSEPFFSLTQAMAVRSFSDVVNGGNSVVGKHPEDFTLFQIGEYEDTFGLITTCDPFIPLATASQVKVLVDVPRGAARVIADRSLKDLVPPTENGAVLVDRPEVVS